MLADNTDGVGRGPGTRCSPSDSNVLEFGFQLDSFPCRLTYSNLTGAKFDLGPHLQGTQLLP